MESMVSEDEAVIEYSSKYRDELHEFRHVVLPRALAKRVPRAQLLSEREWRELGVEGSRGWQHYETRQPGTTLVFRRPLALAAAVAAENERERKAAAAAQKAEEKAEAAAAALVAEEQQQTAAEAGATASGAGLFAGGPTVPARQRLPARLGGFIG